MDVCLEIYSRDVARACRAWRSDEIHATDDTNEKREEDKLDSAPSTSGVRLVQPLVANSCRSYRDTLSGDTNVPILEDSFADLWKAECTMVFLEDIGYTEAVYIPRTSETKDIFDALCIETSQLVISYATHELERP